MVQVQSESYYDAIILDINMPIMNGMEACKKIKHHLNSESLRHIVVIESTKREVSS